MDNDTRSGVGMIASGQTSPQEATVLSKERWAEVRRLHQEEGMKVSELARRLDLDRKTVRKALREEWTPYRRALVGSSLLGPHEAFLRERAAEVQYSARVLYQELLRERGYRGGYDTVKRFVAPLRAEADRMNLCQTRFETEPGAQSQIDWGQVRTFLRAQPATLHFFVLTLGYSRRGYYHACGNEQLGAFFEAHEAAFAHFGGLTHEHLYDRPRTVGDTTGGKWRWNATFRAFSRHWGFEPRVCAPYRAQTKGEVESGVKYLKRNFMAGRHFIDVVDVQAQLDEWNATVADVRVHGTTHMRPIDRFECERPAMLPSAGHPAFGESRRVARIVADDYLVSFESNRYSVPCGLIGKVVDVVPCGAELRFEHGGRAVAEHPRLAGKHQTRILPEHGPGPIARNARQRHAPGCGTGPRWIGPAEVEIRDLAVYEEVAA